MLRLEEIFAFVHTRTTFYCFARASHVVFFRFMRGPRAAPHAARIRRAVNNVGAHKSKYCLKGVLTDQRLLRRGGVARSGGGGGSGGHGAHALFRKTY